VRRTGRPHQVAGTWAPLAAATWDARQRRAMREDVRRLAQQKLPAGLVLSEGYRLRPGLIVCDVPASLACA
jgi:hypothetical protein